MPKQTCSKAKRKERAVGWDHSQGVPELLHCDRAVWGCVALRSAQPVWCGPSIVLGRSCLQPNPCSCQDFPRKSCSGFFWANHLRQFCATSALSISRLSCPSPLLRLSAAHSACKVLCCCIVTIIASCLKRGIITPF